MSSVFGYRPQFSKIPTTSNLGNISEVAPTDTQILQYDLSSDSWAPTSISPGDVVGPSSNDTDAVALYDGSTGLLLKSDPGLTYNTTTNTLYTTNISRSGTGDLDITASTSATTSAVNIYLPDGDSQGALYLKSGDDTDGNLTGAQIQIDTRPSVTSAGRVVLTTGYKTSATTKKNSVTVGGSVADIEIVTTSNANSYIQTLAPESGDDGAPITFTAGTASGSGNSGNVNLVAGASVGTADGGAVTVAAGGSTSASATNQTGGNVTVTSEDDISLVSGTANNSFITASSTDSYATLYAGTATTGGYFKMGLNAGNGHVTMGAQTTTNGGTMTFQSPDSAGTSDAGGISITSYLTSSASSSTINITAGDCSTGTGSGGAISFVTGAGDGSGSSAVSGSARIHTGTNSGATPGDTGDITITSGSSTHDSGGDITIAGGTGVTGGYMNINNCINTASNTTSHITLTPGSGGTTDGDLIFETAGNQYFWIDASSIPNNCFMYLSPGLQLTFGHSADHIFKSGTLLKEWTNVDGSSGLNINGNASITGTYGSDTEVTLRLTPNITSQTGRVYFDVSGATGYNSSYLRNWEFRFAVRSNAVAGTSGGWGFWIYGQGNAHTTGAYGDTGGISLYFDENDSNTWKHNIWIYGSAGRISLATAEEYLGINLGGVTTHYRVRKQAQTILVEIDRNGAGSSSGSTSRTYTIAESDETTGTNWGIGAITGPTLTTTTSFHQVSFMEIRQIPDNTPIIRKF